MAVVVGVGSAGSVAAVRWAVAEAALRGTVVEAVHAWHAPHAAGAPPDEVGLETAARRLLDAVVQEGAPGTPVTRLLVRGLAASALLDGSRHADLVVLGGAGEVARHVLAHASCPVVVVPA